MINRSSTRQQVMKAGKSGAKFKALTAKLKKRGAKNPKALAAFIGRKKYGPKKMTEMAQKGKRKAKKGRKRRL